MKRAAYAVVAGLALAATVSGVQAAEALKPKALVIMLDGMRADSIENVYAPRRTCGCSATASGSPATSARGP